MGQRFGHYTLLGRLGAGGMGEVSLARDDRLGREVALKMLPRRLARDPVSLARFRREALTLASLNHPNIAVIHGFEEDAGGALALVLERVEGESLAERLRRGPLPPAEAMQVCVQIAEALEVAHERGVVHRDLKPGNVMLAPRGLVKVLDFGLARRIGDAPAATDAPPGAGGVPGPTSDDDAATVTMPPRAGAGEAADTVAMAPRGVTVEEADTVAMVPPGAAAGEEADTVAMAPRGAAGDEADTVAMAPPAGESAPSASLAPTLATPPAGGGTGLSTTGEVSGTPGYMSPEQVRGEEQDHRTDIFAFGCVLYECLTGSRAVPGRTLIEMMKGVLDHPVELASLPERTPPAVRDLLGKCLERDRALRLGEMRAARHVLEETLGIRRAAALRAGETAEVPNNLPAAVTSFVGRERELADCARQLEATRWLTLAGMGGSGKTRLARRLAEQSLDAFGDGVWFVDLTALKHPERVPESLAEAAGIQQEPGVPILRTLTRTFAERRVLVVLDNCEDVLEPVAMLASELLGACPALKLLATSREPIGAPGEVVVAVAPLALPAEGAGADPGVLAANEAVRLFVERAVAASPAFTLGAGNAEPVAEICRRLDGIPLAIELAAARVRMLSLAEIRARLGDRFKLLTAGGRGAPGRHQTLRATLQWSFDHLSDDERELFVRLGVFVGAWSLESAVAVAGPDRDEFEVLDALTRLVDRSLAVVTPVAAGETRYRFLETVRHFALERLEETGAEEATRDRHLEYFLRVAEESQSALAGPDQKRWLSRLDVEHSDLLAAHAWCGGADGRAVRGLRLVGALWGYWSARGRYGLARRSLGEALDRPGAGVRDAPRAAALVRMTNFALYEGDYDSAWPPVAESLSISRELGDRQGVARCLGTLATIAIFKDALEDARVWSTECLDVYRDLGRPLGVASALQNLGHVALRRGDLDEAHSRYEEAIAALAGTGDDRRIALALTESARVAMRRGEWEAARIRFATALGLASGLGARREGAYGLEGAGELAAASGDMETAVRLVGAALAIREAIGSPLTPAESAEQAALLDRLRDTLGAPSYGETLGEGRTLDFGPAIDMARIWLEGRAGAAGSTERPSRSGQPISER
jgi:predicted ATPase/serine/threonine protein kinase